MLNPQAGLPIRSILSKKKKVGSAFVRSMFHICSAPKDHASSSYVVIVRVMLQRESGSIFSALAQGHSDWAFHTGAVFVQIDTCFIVVDKSSLS